MTLDAQPESNVEARTRPHALALVRWALLAVGALVLAWPYRHGRLPMDLHVYVKGGQAVAHRADLYGPSVSVSGYPFTYPPFAALPFALIADLPVWVIIVVTCAAFYASLVAVVRWCAPGALGRAGYSWRSWLPVAVIGALVPVWATLHDGQVNMILAALVVGDALVVRRGRGALVGVAAAIKLTPAVFILYFVVTRQWAAARNAVLGFAACTGLAWLILPSDSWRYWTHTLFDTSRIGDISRVSNQSLSGLAHKQFSGTTDVPAVWLGSALIVAVVTLWTAARLHSRGYEVLALGIVGVLGCLLSPITWTHHWVWVVPLLFGVLSSPAWRSRWVQLFTVVACAVFVRGASAPPPDLPVLHLVLGNLFTLIGLAAIAITAIAVVRQPSHARGAPQL